MNYLAHIYLSGTDRDMQVGGLLGDFVKGPLTGQYPETIERGITLHRQIDRQTDEKPEFQAALELFDSGWRRYGGILLDIYFDHLLASQWSAWHRQQLPDFCQGFYQHLQQYEQILPTRARHFARVAPEVAWLESYAVAERVPQMLQRVGQRFRKPVPLEKGWLQLQRHRTQLQEIFDKLWPELIDYAECWPGELDNPGATPLYRHGSD